MARRSQRFAVSSLIERLEIAQAERSPETRVPAAYDAHVGADGLEELRGLDAVLGRKRLAEPERAGCHPR